MQLGKGIKEAPAEKLLGKIKMDLLETEVVEFVCKCNNFKPMVDRIVVTNQRLLAMSATEGQIKYEAHYGEVIGAVAESAWAGVSLTITKTGGATTVFKSMDLADAESARNLLMSSPFVGSAIPYADVEPVPSDNAQAEIVETESGALTRFGSAIKKTYNDAQAAHEDRISSNRETYGRLVKKEDFGSKTVEIYETGFVRVGTFLTAASAFQRLRSVSFSSQVQDKSAGGRALAAGLTMGLSAFTSNEKRTLFLTIATDEKVHTLQAEGGMSRTEDKAGLGLQAAAQAVLESLQPNREIHSQTTSILPAASLGEQLLQLADLHKQGILSDAEFITAKASLLGSG